jgi:hypothetical protein
MFSLFVIAILKLAASQCDTGLWGNDCKFICGNCKYNDDLKTCNASDGKCDTLGCTDGWSGDDCQRPVCANDMCGPKGSCVKPNECVCPELWSKAEDGGCYSLRVSGLKGAAISLVVLIVSILACQGGYKFVHSNAQNNS